MPGGRDLLKLAEAHLGERYVNQNVPKNDPDWKGPWDCAEFASWLVFQVSGQLYGCGSDDVAKAATTEAYTGFWERDAKRKGQMIPVEQAAGTKGAFLLRYPPAPGVMGHIAVSDGQGGTVEAMGKRNGVARGKVSGRRWDTGVLVPGIDYGAQADLPQLTVTAPAKIYAVGQPNMSEGVVSAIQRALRLLGFDPGAASGTFDAATAQAVAAFQKSRDLIEDGEVGPATSKALGIDLDIGHIVPAIVSAAVTGVNPLVGIAVSVLPGLVKLLTGDGAAASAQRIGQIVEDITGTADPAQARGKLDVDPGTRAALQARLAEIAARQEQQREEQRLDAMQAMAAAERTAREQHLASMKEQLADIRDARVRANDWTAAGGPNRWGPMLVTITVLAAFMIVLVTLLWFMTRPLPADNEQLHQLINIAFGALMTAFATVVSFWLGSSQGSRTKDQATTDLQVQQSRQMDQVIADARLPQAEAAATATATAARTAAVEAAAQPRTSNFAACVDIIFGKEGGFSNDPEDNGGATNFGITIDTLRRWRGDPKLTEADVRALDRDEACEIYRVNYWNAMRCDDLPRGVDLLAFDFGVNAGPSRSAKMLQKIVGADPDGSVGPATLAAVKTRTPRDIIVEMSRKRLEYYRGLDDWPRFGNGWQNRTNAVEKKALDMAQGSG